MKTIKLSISEQEIKRFNLNEDKLNFSALVRKITAELAKEALEACHIIAKSEKLDSISLEDIN
ncbi:MAG: hypothetical protein AAGI38_25465, partial [Bacteroidota bacterium]